MRWQPWARGAVALAGVACAAAVYLSYHDRKPATVVVPPRVEPTQTSQMAAGEYVRRKDGRETLNIRYGSRTTFADGRVRFEQAQMRSFDEHALEVTADVVESKADARRSENPAALDLTGHVTLRTKDGLEALMDEATYDDGAGTISAPGRVTFTRGRMAGEGLGATYNEKQDVLSLLDQAHVRVGADEHGAGALDATSRQLTLIRPAKLVRLDQTVHIVRDGDALFGDNAVLHMTPDESRLRRVELREHARVEPGTAKPGTAPPDMRADEIDLDLHDDGQTIRRANLASRTTVAIVDMASDNGHRIIEGMKIGLDLARDGQTLLRIDADQRVVATLPKTEDLGGRKIEADTLRAAGREPGGLSDAVFEGRRVVYREELPLRAAPGGRMRTVTSSRLELALKGELDAIAGARFITRVQLTDPDGTATADSADYDPDAKRMKLHAATGSPEVPTASSGDRHVSAREIELHIDSSDLDAHGSVVTRVQPSAKSGDTKGDSPLFKPGSVIDGAADDLKFVGNQAMYTGTITRARLRQGQRYVTGTSIVYDSDTNDLEATGNVASRMLTDKPASGGQGSTASVYTIDRADSLVYDDGARTARYKGAAIQVHSPDGESSAKSVDLKFAQDSGDIQEMTWDVNVTFALTNGRRGTGTRLTYRAAAERYELTGKPAQVLSPESAGSTTCRLMNGETISFEKNGDAQGGLSTGQILPCNTPLPHKEKEPKPMATLRTEGLTKSYGGRMVVRNINLQVASGEIVGLLGPNGAGKTTTFSMVVGLTGADAGQVLLDDERVTADPMYIRARKGIGYLPQEPSVFRGLTVEKNVLAILETQPISAAERRRRLAELLGELNLTPLARSKAHTLSGGERRRVEITRALVNQPKFMLLDEPFAGIDPIAVGDIQKIIFHLRDRGIGVLITDHNVRETLKITDRAYIVHGGVIFRSGTPASLAADEEVKRIYLGADFRLD